MKYLLGLSFYYKRYKKDAKLNIYLGDRLLDQILLKQNIGPKVRRDGKFGITDDLVDDYEFQPSQFVLQHYKKIHKKYVDRALLEHDTIDALIKKGIYKPTRQITVAEGKIQNSNTKHIANHDPTYGADSESKLFLEKKARENNVRNKANQTRIAFVPEKLFLYEIDDSEMPNKFSIEIDNDDTNYTNGFMSRAGTLNFQSIFLIPKHLVDEGRILDVFKRFWKNSFYEVVKGYPQYWDNPAWPVAFVGTSLSYKGQTPRIQHFYDLELGGSLTIKTHILKKHGIFVLGDDKRHQGRYLIWPHIIETLHHYGLLNT